MKKQLIYLCLFCCLGFSSTAWSQKTVINLYGGYTFRDKLSFTNGYGYINDNAHYGASVEFFVKKYKSIELLYDRMDTKTPLYDYNGVPYNPGGTNISVNYILLNFINYFPASTPAVSPYLGAGLGVGIVDSKDGPNTVTKFAWDLKGGVRVRTSKAIGFKLQGELKSIVQGVGGDLYIGTGGTGGGITSYSTMLQFSLTGGICIFMK